MAGGKKKGEPIAGKGTPSESERRVLKRAEEPISGDTPDAGGLGEDAKIEPIDLALHGDGVNHWQDELPSKRNPRREREGKIPPKDDK